jgi:hypothetical protein
VPKGIQYKVDIVKSTKTYYDYEIEYNETKRTINLLKPEYINAVKDELKRVFGREIKTDNLLFQLLPLENKSGYNVFQIHFGYNPFDEEEYQRIGGRRTRRRRRCH